MNDETIEYRLKNIEATLLELKNLVTETKLQQQSIDNLEANQKDLIQRVTNLEKKPAQEKASKFDTVVNLIFKVFITSVIVLVLTKVGLPV